MSGQGPTYMLESGRKIAVAEVEFEARGIDTPEDYAAFVAEMKRKA